MLVNPVCYILGAVIIFIVVYAFALATLTGKFYYFDARDIDGYFQHRSLLKPDDEQTTFEPHAKRYQNLAQLIVTLAAASIAVLINFLLATPDKTKSTYAGRLEAAAPGAIFFLSLSVFLGLLFILLQSYFYEVYVHSLNRSSYTRYRYALSMATGHCAFLFFVLAYANLAWHFLH